MRDAVIVEAVRTPIGKGRPGGALHAVHPVELLGGVIDALVQQAVHFAARGVLAGAYDLVIACGVESMSRVPMWSNVPPGTDPLGPGIAARYPDGLVPQGISAELIAAKWSLDRELLDSFAVTSHQRAARASADGLFANEIVPVAVNGRQVSNDESIRQVLDAVEAGDEEVLADDVTRSVKARLSGAAHAFR